MKLKKIVLILGFGLILSFRAIAQEDPPPEEVPIDGGIFALIGLSTAWGIKLLRDRKTK